MTIYVLPPRSYPETTEGYDQVIDVTTRGLSIFRYLSPMLLGPVIHNGEIFSKNVENAWQFSKVYPGYEKSPGVPSAMWKDWSRLGRENTWAQRYPMGKGKIPLYSYWDGKCLDYIQSRKEIYVPLYRETVQRTQPRLWNNLVTRVKGCASVTLLDFDAYDHLALGMSLDDVLNNPAQKMGHGFVLAMMLEQELNLA